MKRTRIPGTLEGIRPGESLDEFEKRVGDDIPEATEDDFARARSLSDFPELKAAIETARRKPREPEPAVDVSPPVAVRFDDHQLYIRLADDRELSVPLTWYPDVAAAPLAQREAFSLTPTGVRWSDLDEEASIADILRTQLKIAALDRKLGNKP